MRFNYIKATEPPQGDSLFLPLIWMAIVKFVQVSSEAVHKVPKKSR